MLALRGSVAMMVVSRLLFESVGKLQITPFCSQAILASHAFPNHVIRNIRSDFSRVLRAILIFRLGW